MEPHYKHVARRSAGRDLIGIQDTTEYNYEHHKGIIKEGELGTISDNASIGLRVHPMLIMDAEDHFPYGFSSMQIVNRAGKTLDRHERKYQKLPIEEKESYRWLKAIEETKQRLAQAKTLTIIADRESDIYQLWSRTLDEKTHLVIRTSLLRKFIDEQENEIQSSSSLISLGSHTIYIPGRLGKQDKGRQAGLEISFQKGYTLKPKKLKEQKSNSDPDRIELNMLSVKEILPEGADIKEPVSWLLLTDLPIKDLKDALHIIHLYKSRWNIEQVFRLTKQKGFNIEESQLETARGLENLISLVFIAVIRIYQMVKSRDNQQREVGDIFEENQQQVLEKINPSLEGRTERSKNRNRPKTLAYYIWVIARLGNWKPEDRDPPGPMTFKRGWESLQAYLKIAQLSSSP